MADSLFDVIVRHQVGLERAKAGEVKGINKLILSNDKDVLAILSTLPENYTQRQLNTVLKRISALNLSYYKGIIRDELESVAATAVSMETDFAAKSIDDFLESDIPVRKVDKKSTLARTLATPYEGHKLSTWVNRLARDKSKRIAIEVRGVAIKNGDVSKILTAAKRGIRASNSNNQSVTKAYINQSTNFSRDDVYLANDDRVKNISWSSILDSGTTLTCGVRSNKLYNAVTKEPIGHGEDYGAGPGLIHWACRSFPIPVDEGGVITSGPSKGHLLDKGTRTAIGAEKGYERGGNENSLGKRAKVPSKANELEVQRVSSTLDYETWLKRQPRDFVRDSIGVTKADAFLSGKAKLGDFVVQDGRELSVKQLEKTLNLGE